MKWVRAKDGVIAGVCKGMAKSLDLEVGWVRLVWLLSLICFGVGFVPYILLAVCLPREDKTEEALKPKFLGVCFRISKRTGIEVGLVRLLCLILFLSSFGLTLIGYIILHFALEEKSTDTINSN